MNEIALRSDTLPSLTGRQLLQQQNASRSVRYAWGVLLGRWKTGAAVAIAIFALILAIGLLRPRTYYSEALLVIHPLSNNLAQPEDARSTLPPDTSAIDTEVEVLRSPAVAEAVVKKLALYRDPDFGGSPGAKATPENLRNATTIVENSSAIRRVGLTYAVQVGFTARSAGKATQIANALIDAYLNRKLNEKLTAISNANRDLGATLSSLRMQALNAEAKVEDYKARNNLLSVDGASLTEGELSALNQRIADAQADAAEKRARVSAALAQAHRGGGGADVGATLASGTVAGLRQKEADVSAQLSQLETQFQPEYPAVQKARAELADIRRQLGAETSRILSSLRADAAVASQRESSLVASREMAKQRLAANNKSKVGLLTLQQTADASKKIYETYLSRASEVTAQRNLQQPDASIDSRAMVQPGSPFSSLRVIGAIAAILALIGGLASILISELWDRRLRSWTDVERNTGLPLAGVMPHVPALDHSIAPAEHISARPLTAFAESLRNLRAFLTLSGPMGAKVTAVTSAVPGEGKTLTSVCLARTLATNGAKVVLLDCDLRRASASKFFGQASGGIAEVIGQTLAIEDALVYDEKSGIWLLTGSLSRNVPGDLFNSRRIDELLASLRTKFDHIVIDTSPLLGFADARIMAAKADRVLYVVQWNKTPASMVNAAVAILQQSNVKIAAAVLNKVDVKQQARYGFADGSDYYHYYGLAYAQ
jgi:succinoglycan biosynthesis transport protein ExoP